MNRAVRGVRHTVVEASPETQTAWCLGCRQQVRVAPKTLTGAGGVAKQGWICRNGMKEAARRTLYGMEPEEHEELLQEQGGVCAICGGIGTRALGVDHDHVTGKVRGLLCDTCNRGLGFFKENSDLLAKAFCYLRRHEP